MLTTEQWWGRHFTHMMDLAFQLKFLCHPQTQKKKKKAYCVLAPYQSRHLNAQTFKVLPCPYHFVSEHSVSYTRCMTLLQEQMLLGELSVLREPLLRGQPRAERTSFEQEWLSQEFLTLPMWSRYLGVPRCTLSLLLLRFQSTERVCVCSSRTYCYLMFCICYINKFFAVI